jgi:hypothetical protein
MLSQYAFESQILISPSLSVADRLMQQNPPKEHEKNPSCSSKSLPVPLARNSHNRCDERSSNALRPESFFYNSQRSSSVTILPSRNSGYKELTSVEVRYVIATKLASTPGLRRSRARVQVPEARVPEELPRDEP